MATATIASASIGRTKPARSSFHLVMALVMAGVTVYGFSQTIGDSLIRPKIALPSILYVHATLFSAWMAAYVLQTALVRTGRVMLHRQLGLVWLCLGTTMPFVGIATALVMRRFDILHFHRSLAFLVVPLWDMVAFTPCFVMAALWRKRPEYHRRLMFLATCMLLDAGLARFPLPDAWFDAAWFYIAIDGLVLIAMARDFMALRRVHPVFVAALPLVAVGQIITWMLWRHPPAAWLDFCRALVGAG